MQLVVSEAQREPYLDHMESQSNGQGSNMKQPMFNNYSVGEKESRNLVFESTEIQTLIQSLLQERQNLSQRSF